VLCFSLQYSFTHSEAKLALAFFAEEPAIGQTDAESAEIEAAEANAAVTAMGQMKERVGFNNPAAKAWLTQAIDGCTKLSVSAKSTRSKALQKRVAATVECLSKVDTSSEAKFRSAMAKQKATIAEHQKQIDSHVEHIRTASTAIGQKESDGALADQACFFVFVML